MGYTNVGRFLLTNWIQAPANVVEPAVGVLRWMVILPFFVIIREYLACLLVKFQRFYICFISVEKKIPKGSYHQQFVVRICNKGELSGSPL